jgi:hypothetical protein
MKGWARVDTGPFRFRERVENGASGARERLAARLDAIAARLGVLPPRETPEAVDVRERIRERLRELGVGS